MKEYLVVDGYNVINGWDELRAGLCREDYIKVAVSDWLEQIVVLGLGAVRLPVRELILEVASMKKVISEKYINRMESKKNLLENNINLRIRNTLEKCRRENTET